MNTGSDVEIDSEVENESDQEQGPNPPTASLDDSTSIIYEPRIIGSLKSYLPPDNSKDLVVKAGAFNPPPPLSGIRVYLMLRLLNFFLLLLSKIVFSEVSLGKEMKAAHGTYYRW